MWPRLAAPRRWAPCWAESSEAAKEPLSVRPAERRRELAWQPPPGRNRQSSSRKRSWYGLWARLQQHRLASRWRNSHGLAVRAAPPAIPTGEDKRGRTAAVRLAKRASTAVLID